ncbi:Flp family type IVb pilin [Sphingomonas sp. S1-29]|uniref:Flp family type IVb pilin n=1 Tax=Sphingomonas sp. S1-29 TaxID=2991074 RepID=UPI00224097EB|nr:Flp family type IVb pilin [Sphingomonas sp. S1-29]UZK70733.1 Flp family type IVb pilin [Sphingomonas sp. S1-29]
MRRFFYAAKRLFDDRRGATAVEYGLILALVFLAIVGAIAGVADATIGMWDGVSTDVEEVTTGRTE